MDTQDLALDPFLQFQLWLQDAEKNSQQGFPNAMTLATVDSNGHPSARIVLLKGLSPAGFTFFTNYSGRKADDLATNSWAALCFYWDKLGRQIRAEGQVHKVPRAESQAYFSTRPRQSQLGAWASPQSQVIPSRDFLETRFQETEERFAGVVDIPVPENWGGYCLKPERFEFWQLGAHRLHDRFEYLPKSTDEWQIQRLAP